MSEREREPTFAYLSIAELAESGVAEEPAGPWVGGYLIVTAAGRPLEFHCTAPVVASRAQQILYGKSLRPFVFGEHLGATLVAKARLKPSVLLVDDADSIAAGRRSGGGYLPTVLLAAAGQKNPVPPAERIDLPGADAWLLSPGGEQQSREAADKLRLLSQAVELAEPFERIREAIGEAQRGAAGTGGAPIRDAA